MISFEPMADDATARVDARLLERTDRTPKGVRGRPAEVDGALENCSKQLQLMDIERQVFELARGVPERIARTRPIESAGPGSERVLAEATHALAKFAPASALAKKAFVGFRALKKIALRQPYPRGN